jgi:hypothetical protein
VKDFLREPRPSARSRSRCGTARLETGEGGRAHRSATGSRSSKFVLRELPSGTTRTTPRAASKGEVALDPPRVAPRAQPHLGARARDRRRAQRHRPGAGGALDADPVRIRGSADRDAGRSARVQPLIRA